MPGRRYHSAWKLPQVLVEFIDDAGIGSQMERLQSVGAIGRPSRIRVISTADALLARPGTGSLPLRSRDLLPWPGCALWHINTAGDPKSLVQG